MIDTTEWMTPKEVASELGVSDETVYRMIRKNILRSKKWGSGLRKPARRIDRASVDKFKAEGIVHGS